MEVERSREAVLRELAAADANVHMLKTRVDGEWMINGLDEPIKENRGLLTGFTLNPKP